MATLRSSPQLPKLQSWPARLHALRCIIGSMTHGTGLHSHLTAWRTSKGLSQEQVANILGVNKSTVHRWETGKRAVDLEDLRRLAEIYEVDPIALLLSPTDHDLARRLHAALEVLKAAPDGVADRWLQIGADLAKSTLP